MPIRRQIAATSATTSGPAFAAGEGQFCSP
jgi:hypothetical protein